MEVHRFPLSVRRCLRAAVVVIVGLAAGCKTTSQCTTCGDGGVPVSTETNRMVATWSNKVQYVPDVAHGGTPMPGILGRVYLFDAQVKDSLTTDGKFVAELYDDSGSTSVAIEQWIIDKDTAKKLLSKDIVGWGYTMFLPWGTYRPDLTKIHVGLRFEPEKGQTMMAMGGPMTVEHLPPPTAPGAGVQQTAARVPAGK
ncbi:MAG: hypothetical protein U0746_07580 [Gemmataceae bacterium]